jgi:hypothetical protein
MSFRDVMAFKSRVASLSMREAVFGKHDDDDDVR